MTAHAHFISSRSDYDPQSAFLLAMYIVMTATLAAGLAMAVAVFFI
jgi:hypothetical protein